MVIVQQYMHNTFNLPCHLQVLALDPDDQTKQVLGHIELLHVVVILTTGLSLHLLGGSHKGTQLDKDRHTDIQTVCHLQPSTGLLIVAGEQALGPKVAEVHVNQQPSQFNGALRLGEDNKRLDTLMVGYHKSTDLLLELLVGTSNTAAAEWKHSLSQYRHMRSNMFVCVRVCVLCVCVLCICVCVCIGVCGCAHSVCVLGWGNQMARRLVELM